METYLATLQVILGLSLGSYLVFFGLLIAKKLSPDDEGEPESFLNTPDKQEKKTGNKRAKKEDDKSTKSSDITEYSNKYFDPIKSMYNFFKTVMLAISTFMIILYVAYFLK